KQLSDLSKKKPQLVLDNVHMTAGTVLPDSGARQVGIVNYPDKDLDLLTVYKNAATTLEKAMNASCSEGRIGHLVPGFGDSRADQGVEGLAHRQVSQHLVSMSPHAFRDRCSGRCLVGHGATVRIGRKRRRGAFLPEWGPCSPDSSSATRAGVQ